MSNAGRQAGPKAASPLVTVDFWGRCAKNRRNVLFGVKTRAEIGMTDTVNADRKPVRMAFNFFMTRLRPIEASFSESSGFSRKFSVFGVCNNGEADEKKRFIYRKVRATFFAPMDPNSSDFLHFHDIRLFKKHGVEEACGQMRIRKGGSDGPSAPPFEVVIAVDHDTLDRVWGAANGTFADRRALALNVVICSSTFPDYSDRRVGGGICDDLDVSEDQIYPVKNFYLKPTNIRLPERAEVRPRIHPLSSKDHVSFGLIVDKVEITMDERLQFRKIVLDESESSHELKQSRKRPYMSVEISEYEIDSETEEYPDIAWCGNFFFAPKPTQLGDDIDYLNVNLWFTRHDFGKAVPLFLTSTKIVLEVSLDICKADLEMAKDRIYGNVRYFEFELSSTKVGPP